MPSTPHALSLTPQPHISSSQSHSLCLSPFTHSLTWPQAHKQSNTSSRRRQSHTIATRSQAYNSLLSQLHFVLTVTDLTLSHSPLPLSSSSPMASRPRFTSISIFFSGLNSSQCEFVFVILKGKIIDLAFVFRIFVFMFVIVFGFMFVFVILG